jgi:hydrogenase maturation protease
MTARLAIVGLGNTLAGDDGVGVRVAERLAARLGDRDDVMVTTLGGDLFEIADRLGEAERFLFVDAIAGDTPGELRSLTHAPRALAASMHQSDIGSVMDALRSLGVVEPFPEWEVWGVVIAPPDRLGEGLSPDVAAAAAELERRIVRYVEANLTM